METQDTVDKQVIKEYAHIFEGWDVKRAILIEAFPLPHGGDTTTSFYASIKSGIGSASGRTGIQMKYHRDGLFCEYKGSAFIIPLSNVKGVYL